LQEKKKQPPPRKPRPSQVALQETKKQPPPRKPRPSQVALSKTLSSGPSVADRKKNLFSRAAANNTTTTASSKPSKKWPTVGSEKKQGSNKHARLKSSTSAYGGFTGIPTNTTRGLKKSVSSIASRASVFGGTTSKKATGSAQTSKKSKKSNNTSSVSTKNVFDRSIFAKKATPASSTKGVRLRGSSITSKRRIPAIVRNSIEKNSQVAVQIVQVKARFSFDAENPDELDFHTGDVIEILNDESGDWWKGRLNNKVGIFPKSYAGDVF
jgi:hypothetical protein